MNFDSLESFVLSLESRVSSLEEREGSLESWEKHLKTEERKRRIEKRRLKFWKEELKSREKSLESKEGSLEEREERLESREKDLEPKGFAAHNKAAAALAYYAIRKKLPFHYAIDEFIEKFNWNNGIVSGVMIRETFERCPHIMKWDTDLDVLAHEVLQLIIRETS